MIAAANKSKSPKCVKDIIEYALEMALGIEGKPRQARGELGSKLVAPPIFRNMPMGKDPVKYLVGLSFWTRSGCNHLLPVIFSLPDGVVWFPSRWELYLARFLHHLSKTTLIRPRQNGKHDSAEAKTLTQVDIEKELPYYAVVQCNTNNQHMHCGVGLVHPKYRRVVDINHGHFRAAIQFARLEALRDLGYAIENPYRLGSHKGQPVIDLRGNFDKDGVLIPPAKRNPQLNKAVDSIKNGAQAIGSAMGICEAKIEPLPAIRKTKAEAIRGRINVVKAIRAVLPEDPRTLLDSNPESNRDTLSDILASNNSGLKSAGDDKDGLVFSAEGLHQAAEDCLPLWTRAVLEKLCGLTGQWNLGRSQKEQSRLLSEQTKADYREACKKFGKIPASTVMRQMLEAFPPQWEHVLVDVLTSDDEIKHVGRRSITNDTLDQNSSSLLDLARIADDDKYPLGMVLVSPELPTEQLPMFFYFLPQDKLSQFEEEYGPAMVVKMSDNTFAAMILVEQLPEGRTASLNARSRLAHDICITFKCKYGIYGMPLPGLPQFPDGYVTTLLGKPHPYTSTRAQEFLVITYDKLKAEHQLWTEKVPRQTKDWLSAEIKEDLAKAKMTVPEALKAALETADTVWLRSRTPASLRHARPEPAWRAAAPKAPSAPAHVQLPTKKDPVKNQGRAPVSKGPSVVARQKNEPCRSVRLPPPLPERNQEAQTPQKTDSNKNSAAPAVTQPPVGPRKLKRNARQLHLLAGYLHWQSQRDELESLLTINQIPAVEAEIWCRVWKAVSTDSKDQAELTSFMNSETEIEPEWLATRLARAEEEYLAPDRTEDKGRTNESDILER